MLWVVGLSELCPLWSQGRDSHGVCLWCPLPGVWPLRLLSLCRGSGRSLGIKLARLPLLAFIGALIEPSCRARVVLAWRWSALTSTPAVWFGVTGFIPPSMLHQAGSCVAECRGGRVSESLWTREPCFSCKKLSRKLGFCSF